MIRKLLEELRSLTEAQYRLGQEVYTYGKRDKAAYGLLKKTVVGKLPGRWKIEWEGRSLHWVSPPGSTTQEEVVNALAKMGYEIVTREYGPARDPLLWRGDHGFAVAEGTEWYGPSITPLTHTVWRD